jgi:hypothetical protein
MCHTTRARVFMPGSAQLVDISSLNLAALRRRLSFERKLRPAVSQRIAEKFAQFDRLECSPTSYLQRDLMFGLAPRVVVVFQGKQPFGNKVKK